MRGQVNTTQCPEPYHWVPAAAWKFADRRKITKKDALVGLLAAALKRGPKGLVVLRAPPSDRSSQLNAFPISQETEGALLATLAVVQEGSRARALQSVARALRSTKPGASGVGWRIRREGSKSTGLLLLVAGGAYREQDELFASETEVTLPALVRALMARELEAEGLAPKNWSVAKPTARVNGMVHAIEIERVKV